MPETLGTPMQLYRPLHQDISARLRSAQSLPEFLPANPTIYCSHCKSNCIRREHGHPS